MLVRNNVRTKKTELLGRGALLVLVLTLMSVGVVGVGTVRAAYQVGDTVEDFVLPGLDGETHALSELRGRVVLLNFFATWCLGCNVEAEHLQNDLWEVYESRGLTVVAVDIQEPESLVDGWAQALEVDYPIWLAPDWSLFQLFTQFGGLPYNTVIDTEGVLRYSQTGFDLTALTDMIDLILETAVPAEQSTWSAVKSSYR